MKRFFLFIALVLCTMSANAEKIVGTYKMAEMPREIEAAFDDNGALHVFVEVLGENENDKVMILISGENDLNQFISKLEYCKEKFKEWEKVAKTNNVTDYSKEFDVTFPDIEIYWWGEEWFSTFSRNYLKPLFFVGSDGKASFGASGKVKDWFNEDIDQQWYLILKSESEFDELIDALNPEKIKSELNKNENVDDLFQ